MSVNEKMTALANEIRTLSGTTDAMGLDDMKTNVATANADVATEADLIAQISAALEGKAAGGGGSGNVSAEWQDVFALPTTYIPTHAGCNFYYIEIPDNLKAVSLRCSNDSYYGSASAIVMNDGSNISFSSEAISCSISILNEENVIEIGVDLSTFTTAEYLIV